MAEEVNAAIRSRHVNLVVEAGTGTGKTRGISCRRCCRVIASSFRPGPRRYRTSCFIVTCRPSARRWAARCACDFSRGARTYLCLYRLDALESGADDVSRSLVRALPAVRRWADRTRSGDIAEMSGVAEDSPLWPRVTSTADNCSGLALRVVR